VICCGNYLLRAENFDAPFVQAIESLRAGYFVNKMFVDV
jgi:hypothetical protein